VELYNSHASVVNNTIYNNIFGIKLYNHSYTLFNSSPFQTIRDNTSYELYASFNSFPTIFRHNRIIDEDNLGNTYNDPMLCWDYAALSDTSLRGLKDIRFNYWGVNFNPVEDLYPCGKYDYTPIWIPIESDTVSIIVTPKTDEELYQTGLNYFVDEDYVNAEMAFKNLIITWPESEFAIAALHELFALQQFIDNDYAALHDYYATFTPEESALFEVADFLATRCLVKDRYWQPAIDWYEERIQNPPSYQDSIFAVIDLGDIHLMMEADTLGGAKSQHCSYRLANIKPKSKQEYEENKSALLATLPQIKKPQTESPLNQTGKQGALGQNIPNPATGTTTVSYEVYAEGNAEIRIYNVLGQLMQILPLGTHKQGSYQTVISLTGIPAGLYHYALYVNGERTDARKMIIQ
jgi:hypothetical protein